MVRSPLSVSIPTYHCRMGIRADQTEIAREEI